MAKKPTQRRKLIAIGSGGKSDPIRSGKDSSRKQSKKPVTSFYPSDYSSGELRSIAKGGTPEAYRHSMKRSDVPKTVKTNASAELKRRKK